jgi:hypothetical protein
MSIENCYQLEERRLRDISFIGIGDTNSWHTRYKVRKDLPLCNFS